ncbi:MAG: hypothetical protein AAB793_00360 [Patescibacteria group bacterium]
MSLNRSGIQSFNNLYYNSTTQFYFPSGSSLGWGIAPYYLSSLPPYESYTDWDYSYYSNQAGPVQIPINYDANKQVNNNEPFIDRTGEDFRLTEPTNSGLTLDDEFKYDMYGNVRGADGVWDRGAIEYTASVPPPPHLKGDFNSDGFVNNLDFIQFKNAFKGIFNSIFDLSSDSAIDVKDLGVLMSSWRP